jgi:hypothetical protein
MGGYLMRKLLVVFAAMMVAASPAAAKVKKKAPPPPQPMSQNEASWRLMKESLPLFLPTAFSVGYLATQKDGAQKDDKAKKH